jgi:hypothetical protein
MNQNCLLTLVCVFLIVAALVVTIVLIKNRKENYDDAQYYAENPIESKIVCKNRDNFGCQGFCKCTFGDRWRLTNMYNQESDF